MLGFVKKEDDVHRDKPILGLLHSSWVSSRQGAEEQILL